MDADRVFEDMEVVEKMIKTFITCSGMHQLEKEIDGVKTGECDEVVWQGLLLGPKATLEDFCAIMNNNAVYASLFLSSTLGLLFSPPDCVGRLDKNDPAKLIFFLGICMSVFFNILKYVPHARRGIETLPKGPFDDDDSLSVRLCALCVRSLLLCACALVVSWVPYRCSWLSRNSCVNPMP